MNGEPLWCPFLDRPCIKTECHFWVISDTGLRRPVEGVPREQARAELWASDCVLKLAATVVLADSLRRLP